MAQGFLPGLLLSAKQVFAGIYPGEKITPLGYLEMLLANGQPNIVSSTVDNQGHTRSVTIKYRTRGVAGKSTTVDDCSIQGTNPWKEFTPPNLLFRKRGIFMEYDEIRKYEAEASTSVRVGNPPPPSGIMAEMWGRIIENANGLMQDINSDLLSIQAANFGTNVTSGNANAKTINFPLDTNNNPLTQGLTMLFQDIMENEVQPNNVMIVGAGLINSAAIQMNLNTQNSKQQNYPSNNIIPPMFWDWNTAGKWGANQFGVFERKAVQLININKWGGNFGGDKMSTWLGTIQLPLVDSLGGSLSAFKFDFQLRHIDCPQEVEVDGILQSVGRGWVFDLMANYNQFNLPQDSYEASDRLVGNNGTYRYVATNA